MATQAPDLPDLPNASPELTDFLRRFRAWAMAEIYQSVRHDTAAPQILLSASDQKPPTAVYALTINAAGAIAATAVPLGKGKP